LPDQFFKERSLCERAANFNDSQLFVKKFSNLFTSSKPFSTPSVFSTSALPGGAANSSRFRQPVKKFLNLYLPLQTLLNPCFPAPSPSSAEARILQPPHKPSIPHTRFFSVFPELISTPQKIDQEVSKTQLRASIY